MINLKKHAITIGSGQYLTITQCLIKSSSIFPEAVICWWSSDPPVSDEPASWLVVRKNGLEMTADPALDA
jgi:hypothetical protein